MCARCTQSRPNTFQNPMQSIFILVQGLRKKPNMCGDFLHLLSLLLDHIQSGKHFPAPSSVFTTSTGEGSVFLQRSFGQIFCEELISASNTEDSIGAYSTISWLGVVLHLTLFAAHPLLSFAQKQTHHRWQAPHRHHNPLPE